VTDATAHDDAHLGGVLAPADTASPVWAHTAYRSAANIEMLEKRGLKTQFQRLKPGGKPMPRHGARGKGKRAHPVPRRAEFAAQKCRSALMIRAIGKARATAKLALSNLPYKFTGSLWLETRQTA
jgi:hypothetical protein